MTTIFRDQSAALDQHLSNMADLPPVAWEGIVFEPVKDVLFLKPSLDQLETIAETERDKTVGSYIIHINAPAGDGKGEALAMADKIANHFKHGTELSYNGVNVTVNKTSREEFVRPVGNLNTTLNSAWFTLKIFVEYYSYTVRR